jgi:hypothetical protein
MRQVEWHRTPQYHHAMVSSNRTLEALASILSGHEPVAQHRWEGDELVHCAGGDWEGEVFAHHLAVLIEAELEQYGLALVPNQ